MKNKIVIHGARTHNLQDITLSIPKDKLVVITGPSGSGKSSLAFDTLYAEGQRRYMESLSTYARQFLQSMDKPDVDKIEGLSPAIAINQKTIPRNPRSTVGTITEIYDYLRLLFAKVGQPHCPKCAKLITQQSVADIIKQIGQVKVGTRFMILAPKIVGKKGEHKGILTQIEQNGFLRMRIDNEIMSIADELSLDPHKKHSIEVVVDRLVVKDYAAIEDKLTSGEVISGLNPDATRLADSVELALKEGEGFINVIFLDQDGEVQQQMNFSENFACMDHAEVAFPKITPATFSFNSPSGACLSCHGLGTKMIIDVDLVINANFSLAEGAIVPWTSHKGENIYEKLLKAVAKKYKIPLNTMWKDLQAQQQDIILHGLGEEKFDVNLDGSSFSGSYQSRFEGVIKNLNRRYHQSDSDIAKRKLEEYMTAQACDECAGMRLRSEILSVKIAGLNIIEITKLNINKLADFMVDLKFSTGAEIITRPIIKEIISRTDFLKNVGLSYLSLERKASSLSGGEAQRIRLATQIGSQLTSILYVLDEPSIGLHQADNDRLIQTLKQLRDLGNSVLVVEHDEDMMRAADHIIDIGPYAGSHGGQLVAEGNFKDICANKKSITGDFLSGRRVIVVPKRRNLAQEFIEIVGASEHNLQNVDVKIPVGVFTCITGVSGSGKSSLINGILVQALRRRLYNSKVNIGAHKKIMGMQNFDKIINIDQSPIGRTTRSNPVTYTGTFNEIRDIYAATQEAKIRGYKIGRFSFNIKGGRCDACSGDGVKKIEMYFLPDVYVVCEVCAGKRYNPETLAVTYRGQSIADVLAMTVEEAFTFFQHIPAIKNKLGALMAVGLDYIKLGQNATTLSGGEAQRVKLATELSKRATGKTIYVMDEPTTGLHFTDIEKLLIVLQRLVDKGNTLIVIEHNLDVIKSADHIVDMGPCGGDKGGQVVAMGTPEEVAKTQTATGQWLKKVLV